tara:strand:+ start:8036 stop:8557 length:522 start_codon:yes stop_codon:yes gene_type:complete
MEFDYTLSVTFDNDDTHLSANNFINSVSLNRTININTTVNNELGDLEDFKQRIRALIELILERLANQNELSEKHHNLTHAEYENSINRSTGTKKLIKEKGGVVVCPICLDELKPKRIWHSPPCAHLFHPKCLKKYLTKACVRPICPVCREPIVSDSFKVKPVSREGDRVSAHD